MTTDNITIDVALMKMMAVTTRQKVIDEIKAFANEYHHHFDGFDVVRIDQLLDFLETPKDKNGQEG